MKINAVLTAKNNKTDKKMSNIADFLSASITIILGILSGCTISVFGTDALSIDFTDKFISFYSTFNTKSVTDIFLASFTENVIFLLMVAITGTCVFGYIPIIVITFFKMLGLGCFTGYIFNIYSLKGLEFYLLTQFPGKVFLIFSVIFITKNALTSSKKIKENLLQNERANEYEKELFFRQIIVSTFVLILSSLTDSVLIKSFSPLFNFS